MIKIDFDVLNLLEQKIHATLAGHSKTVESIRITDAAQLCECSVSKISKFTKKLGFDTYKQYLDFLYEREPTDTAHSSEMDRIKQFIGGFQSAQIDELVKLIGTREKLVLLGYGPSFLCAQYFEYRFKTCTKKIVIAVADEVMATSMTDENTLLLILTVTGRFTSFEGVHRDTKTKGGDVAIIVEEYNPTLIMQYDKIFCLTRYTQPSDLQPFEKSRTIFFVFLEEIVQQMMR